eukprot:g109.t1
MTSTWKVLLLLSATTHAQDMLPNHVSVSSVSALGADGMMHTTMHKVMTQMSNNGMEKRIAEVECKDGQCSKSVRHIFAGPLMASIFPSGLFATMPQGLRMPMHEKMHSMMGCFHKMRHHMMQMHARMHAAMPARPGSRAVAKRGRGEKFLAPRVIFIRPANQNSEELQVDPQVMAPMPEAVHQSSMFLETVLASLVLGLSLSLLAGMLGLIFRSCFKKPSAARERPLRDRQIGRFFWSDRSPELGQPLAPEEQADQAELGAAGGAGVEVPVQGVVVPSVVKKSPTQTYLFNLYQRAAEKNETQVAQALLQQVRLAHHLPASLPVAHQTTVFGSSPRWTFEPPLAATRPAASYSAFVTLPGEEVVTIAELHEVDPTGLPLPFFLPPLSLRRSAWLRVARWQLARCAPVGDLDPFAAARGPSVTSGSTSTGTWYARCQAWASQKRGLFALLRRGFVDCITNGCLEAPIFGNRQIEDAFLFLLTLGLRSERRRQNVLLCFRCLRDSESWSMALRGSRRVLELLKELPEEFRDEVLDAAGAAELLLLLGQKTRGTHWREEEKEEEC